jgi:CsoR family transcriptional regulator, copper-sensing transcriptional repressor
MLDNPPPGGMGRRWSRMKKHEDALKRLKTVEGHLRGIQRMVEEEAYCVDVIRQIQAVQAALNKVSNNILEEHLNSCVITAIRGDDPDERERVLKEISGVFEAATKG